MLTLGVDIIIIKLKHQRATLSPTRHDCVAVCEQGHQKMHAFSSLEKASVAGMTTLGLGVLLSAGYAKTNDITFNPDGCFGNFGKVDMAALLADPESEIEIVLPNMPQDSKQFCNTVAQSYVNTTFVLREIAIRAGQTLIAPIVIKVFLAAYEYYSSYRDQ